MAVEMNFPIAIMDFSDLIVSKMLYVDKTDMVAELANQRGAFFLARPRRFGKSTLISTFKELFLHGKKNFAGLKLEKDGLWVNEGSYKVLYLDISNTASIRSTIPFVKRFSTVLAKAFKKYGISWGDNEDWVSNFEDALDQCDDRSIVLLMDEYDAPLIHALNNLDEFEDRREIMTYFFTTLKKYSMKFRFTFITGITEFATLSSFSGPNYFEDLTFDPTYGAITGITQEELETYFKPHIANAAQVLNEKYPGQGWDEEKVLEELKSHYDGYSFDNEAKIRVYNPWSVLRFFKSPQNEFPPYWLSTVAFSSSLLFHSLDRVIKADGWMNKLYQYLASDYETTLSQRQLTASLDIEKIANRDSAFNTILYQAGYLTIKDSDKSAFRLGFPNHEVKTAFADVVIQKLTNEESDSESLRKVHAQKVSDALLLQDYDSIKSEFEKMLSKITFMSLPNFGEYACRDVLCTVLTCLKFQCEFEAPSNTGNADLIVETDKYLYVFEFKVAIAEKEISALLERARDQIKTRRYGVRLTHKTVITCAVVILNTYRDRDRPKDLPHVFKVAELCKVEELP